MLLLKGKFRYKEGSVSTVLVTIPSVHVTMLAPYPYPPIAREMGVGSDRVTLH